MREVTVEMIGLGIENTVTREQLMMLTGQSDRMNRQQIQKMKERGVIICSSCSREGYFRPRKDRPEEIEMAKRDYAELERKAKSMLVQLKALKRALTGNDQLDLFRDAR